MIDQSARVAGRSAPLVVHVTNIPTPYRLPFYRGVRAKLRARGGDLHVFFLGAGNRKREWKITGEEMEGLEYTVAGSSASALADARDLIDRLRPDAVVLAWAMDPLALRLLLFCRRKAIPCVLQTGETLHTISLRKRRRLITLARLPFFRLVDGFIAYGTRAREYLLGSGVDAGRIAVAINVVDTAFFRARIDELRAGLQAAAERDRFRRADGGEFTAHLLFVGELLARKGVVHTLEAFALLDRPDAALHIVGSGPQLDELHALVAEKGLGDRVFFHGYRQKSELPLFYAFSDLLLFPSMEEIFGLVLVEAAAAALPIVASVHAGGTIDVVEEEKNGFIVDPSDLASYARAIARLLDDQALRERMGSASRQKANMDLTVERSADGYLSAIERLWINRRKP